MSTAVVETTAIATQDRGSMVRAEDFMPVFDTSMAVARQKAMSEFIGKILRESTKEQSGDYGVIPGTNKQKVLLKPGAEKLCTFFGLSPRFVPEEVIEDWTGEKHGGEPLFYYRYKCQLFRGERFLAEAVGSCSSRESKYRYREGKRKCPGCGADAIIKGKAEYGGGFLCFGKKGGCGAKFKDNDPAITEQSIGRVINPDIADVVNTCQKIATKRALVAAVLIGTNASDSFTQDIEEQEQPDEDSTEGIHNISSGKDAVRNDDPALLRFLSRLSSVKEAEECLGDIGEVVAQECGEGPYNTAWGRLSKKHGDPLKKLSVAPAFVRELWGMVQDARKANGQQVAEELTAK